jgi:hypothetical protein
MSGDQPVGRECPYVHPVGSRCPNCQTWPYAKGGAAAFNARSSDHGPRSEHARYAFGYSDKKPGLAWWIITGGMVCFVVLKMIGAI